MNDRTRIKSNLQKLSNTVKTEVERGAKQVLQTKGGCTTPEMYRKRIKRLNKSST